MHNSSISANNTQFNTSINFKNKKHIQFPLEYYNYHMSFTDYFKYYHIIVNYKINSKYNIVTCLTTK